MSEIDITEILAIIFVLCVIVTFGYFVTSFMFVKNVPYITPIKSLNDGSRIEGSFFLGSGYIDQEPQYVTYVSLTNGGYKLKTFPADDCVIFMDSENPYVVEWVVQSTMSGLEIKTHSYDFHVPKGTIVERYVLDGNL